MGFHYLDTLLVHYTQVVPGTILEFPFGSTVVSAAPDQPPLPVTPLLSGITQLVSELNAAFRGILLIEALPRIPLYLLNECDTKPQEPIYMYVEGNSSPINSFSNSIQLPVTYSIFRHVLEI